MGASNQQGARVGDGGASGFGYEAAVRAAMAAKNVTILVKPDAVLIAQPAGDLTQDIVAQLNNSVKTVSITPPAGWQPGQPRQAPAAQGR